MKTVLLDNGHGANTSGKRSPDGRLREYKYCREIVQGIHDKLDELDIPNIILVPEETDISLRERVKRANSYKDAILISVHNNAAGNGSKWMSAKGWSGWVAPNASNNSKRLAKILYEAAETFGKEMTGNRSVPVGKFWIGNYAIVRDTNCPAVLTENLFQDNKEDVEYLLSNKDKIIDLHIKGIKEYLGI